MKEIIYALDQEFESRVRLGIMSVLIVNDTAEFKTLKELLELTDGNLSSHLTALEKAGYIQVKKQFIDRKPNTTYSVTKQGRKAFEDHLKVLETLIKKKK
ncbi:MAG TPA: transcriptional regulator [Bacteroidia bacterium]|nr:transcriptional regulator [Bacteroidia bacterium]